MTTATLYISKEHPLNRPERQIDPGPEIVIREVERNPNPRKKASSEVAPDTHGQARQNTRQASRRGVSLDHPPDHAGGNGPNRPERWQRELSYLAEYPEDSLHRKLEPGS